MPGMPGNQPFLSGTHQYGGYFDIIYTLEQSKMTRFSAIALSVKLINLRADPSHGPVIPICNPGLPFTVLEKWIESRKMKPALQA
jgi:hypothetical protein